MVWVGTSITRPKNFTFHNFTSIFPFLSSPLFSNFNNQRWNILHFFILNRFQNIFFFWSYSLLFFVILFTYDVCTICNFDFKHLWNFMWIPKKKSSMNMSVETAKEFVLFSFFSTFSPPSTRFSLFKMKTVGKKNFGGGKRKPFFSLLLISSLLFVVSAW